MPILTAGRVVGVIAAAALTVARDGVRQVTAPDGALVRAADALVQAGFTAYAVGSIAVWTMALWLASRRPGGTVTRDIF